MTRLKPSTQSIINSAKANKKVSRDKGLRKFLADHLRQERKAGHAKRVRIGYIGHI